MRLSSLGSILLFALLIPACSSSKTLSPEDQEKVQKIGLQIDKKDFTIQVSQAQPMRGRTLNLSYGYDLKISNDSAYAYLPYFGVAQTSPYSSNDGGIKFESPMEEYTATAIKDGWNIKFKVNTMNYNYQFFVNVYNNGNASVNVTSYQRDPIMFQGNLKGFY